MGLGLGFGVGLALGLGLGLGLGCLPGPTDLLMFLSLSGCIDRIHHEVGVGVRVEGLKIGLGLELGLGFS